MQLGDKLLAVKWNSVLDRFKSNRAEFLSSIFQNSLTKSMYWLGDDVDYVSQNGSESEAKLCSEKFFPSKAIITVCLVS